MTLVIISGGIDLRSGRRRRSAAVAAASLLVAGVPIPLAIAAGLAIGVVCGAGQRRARRLCRAAALHRHAGHAQHLPGHGADLHRRQSGPRHARRNSAPSSIGSLFGLPQSVVIVAVVALVVWVILKKTPIGEYLLAVGGNEEAATSPACRSPDQDRRLHDLRRAGRIAALILIGRLGAAEPILGNLWELDAIAAAAIGGASLMGGKGSVVGTILGAVILGSHAQRSDVDECPGLLSTACNRPYNPRRDADRSRDKGTG